MAQLSFLAAVEPIVITIKPDVTVSAPIATLADVAELSGDQATIEVLAPLPIVQLPDLSTKKIDDLVITMSIGRNLGHRFRVVGNGTVRRQAITISETMLTHAAQQAIKMGDDEVELSVIRHSGAVIIPAGGDDYRFESDALDKHISGDIPVRVRVIRGERELARALVTIRVQRYRTIAVAARVIKRGELVGAGDFQLQRLALTPQLATAISKLEELSGLETRIDIQTGTPIVPTMVIQPPDVRAGETVALTVSNAHFHVSSTAVALGNGRRGDVINVRRQTDGRTVRVRVDGIGLVTFERE